MNEMSLESISNLLNEIEEKYIKSYQGDLISHYTNINSLISIISTGHFWASNSMFLNDEDEIIHIRKTIKYYQNKFVRMVKIFHHWLMLI